MLPTLKRYDPSDARQLAGLIRCYQQVFAEAPWCEWRRCGVCFQKWGVHQATELTALGNQHCGHAVQEYWPQHEVEAEIQAVINRPVGSVWLATDSHEVVGFCLGFALPVSELDDQLNLPGVAAAFAARFGSDVPLCAFQNDLGIVQKYRGQGIAGQLVRSRMNDFTQAGLTIGVVRTKTLPPTVTYEWYCDRGYEVIAHYHDADGRVVLARSLSGPLL